MKKSNVPLLAVMLVLNLVLASCMLDRNVQNTAANNQAGSSAPAAVPTLAVASNSAASNQTTSAQSSPSLQSQSSNDADLDAIMQDLQQTSEPDVSVDTIDTPPATDSWFDFNGLDQQIQNMQQVSDGNK